MIRDVMGSASLQPEQQAQFSSMLHGALDGQYALVIDARSPREYSEDHLPCAVNLPVVDNEEYAEVGTTHRTDTHRALVHGPPANTVLPPPACGTGGGRRARSSGLRLR